MDDKPFPPELRPLAKLMDRAHPPLVILVGTGVTLGATNQPYASWLGLLEHGVEHLVKIEQLTEKSGRERLQKLRRAFAPFDLSAALDAAQDIEHNLKYPDERDFAAQQGASEQEALEKGMETKSVEFVKQGAEVYHKA